MEIYKPTRIWCEKGDAEAEIMSDGRHGYASVVCPACYFYTDIELNVHSEGTSIEQGRTAARLGQTIEVGPGGLGVTDCTPLSEEVAKDIDPEIIDSLARFFSLVEAKIAFECDDGKQKTDSLPNEDHTENPPTNF